MSTRFGNCAQECVHDPIALTSRRGQGPAMRPLLFRLDLNDFRSLTVSRNIALVDTFCIWLVLHDRF
jgi:hypothetical protein